MTTLTLEQKLWLAGQLPNSLDWIDLKHSFIEPYAVWKHTNVPVKDTEWIYICHLVEGKLTIRQQELYVERLEAAIMNDAYEDKPYYKHSTLCARELIWIMDVEQRTTALMKVKGEA